jgi:hypothetical protein
MVECFYFLFLLRTGLTQRCKNTRVNWNLSMKKLCAGLILIENNTYKRTPHNDNDNDNDNVAVGRQLSHVNTWYNQYNGQHTNHRNRV